MLLKLSPCVCAQLLQVQPIQPCISAQASALHFRDPSLNVELSHIQCIALC